MLYDSTPWCTGRKAITSSCSDLQYETVLCGTALYFLALIRAEVHWISKWLSQNANVGVDEGPCSTLVHSASWCSSLVLMLNMK